MYKPEDQYEQFADLSETPIMDVIVGLATICLLLGGGLAGIYAIGYLAVGRAALAWPLLGTLAALLALNLGARVVRSLLGRHAR